MTVISDGARCINSRLQHGCSHLPETGKNVCIHGSRFRCLVYRLYFDIVHCRRAINLASARLSYKFPLIWVLLSCGLNESLLNYGTITT
jgi:hypothetical protein